jgi:hypothetical protein
MLKRSEEERRVRLHWRLTGRSSWWEALCPVTLFVSHGAEEPSHQMNCEGGTRESSFLLLPSAR